MVNYPDRKLLLLFRSISAFFLLNKEETYIDKKKSTKSKNRHEIKRTISKSHLFSTSDQSELLKNKKKNKMISQDC